MGAAKLKKADVDACAGTVEILDKIVTKIREKHPETEIIFRGDSGFCRDAILDYCERNNIGYVVGMAGNRRLKEMIKDSMGMAKLLYESSNKAERIFEELTYRTKNSWSRERRVVAKAEYIPQKANPRFVVTNLSQNAWAARALYEKLYCSRGEMENRIKEQQLYLFADRTSTSWMSSNQLRLWLSAVAYIFFDLLRTFYLKETDYKSALVFTIRDKILKVSAAIFRRHRKIKISLPRSFPYWDIWIRMSPLFN